MKWGTRKDPQLVQQKNSGGKMQAGGIQSAVQVTQRYMRGTRKAYCWYIISQLCLRILYVTLLCPLAGTPQVPCRSSTAYEHRNSARPYKATGELAND